MTSKSGSTPLPNTFERVSDISPRIHSRAMNDPQDLTFDPSAPSTATQADAPIAALACLCARLRDHHLDPDDRRELAGLYPRHLLHLDRFIAFSELHAEYLSASPRLLEYMEEGHMETFGYPAPEADADADANRGSPFKPLPYGPGSGNY
jgi:hypothetical protein